MEGGDYEMDFCCNEMRERINYDCIEHNNKYSCPVCIIEYNEVYDEYGIKIHDGGASCITINYCPWCGSKLPEPKRDLWFEKLEMLGIDDPIEHDIPKEFRTSEWYLN